MSIDAAIAMNRFGLGKRPDQAIPEQPRKALLAQLDRFDPRPPAIAAQPSVAELASAYKAFQKENRAFREAKKNGTAGDEKAQLEMQKKLARKGLRNTHLTAVNARLLSAVNSRQDFAERLVHFWSNHFAVSVDKPRIILYAGNYEFQAIRPNIMGKFSDLLSASVTHPAMLLYLDQAQSVGPNSVLAARVNARRKRKFGLNENLAREIMELHTLGVRTGYGQKDVTELARALTGITVAGLGGGRAFRKRLPSNAPFGNTVYIDGLHEPGARQIMGKRYAAGGKNQVAAILSDLSTHRATAKHIATKIARHFVSDNPPASLVSRLEKNFLETGGDLPSLYRTLVAAPEAWPARLTAETSKFKSPWDWVVSSLRALNLQELPGRRNAAAVCRRLGQPVWRPESPAGFADNIQNWAGGAALMRRFEVASRVARQSVSKVDARELAPKILPDVLGANTAESIARAESPMQGLSLLLISPEFLRR